MNVYPQCPLVTLEVKYTRAFHDRFLILDRLEVEQRRLAVESFLTEKGHYVEEVKIGTETLLKIDNMYYRIWPKTIRCSRVPIQGANLVPVYR